jgi:glycosyltransferase involved in cell wall biosynthesis
VKSNHHAGDNYLIKLTFIITGLNIGGAEMMLLKLIEGLSSEFVVQVISLTNLGPIGQRIQSLGVPVLALGMSRGVASPVAFFRLVKTLKDSQPDIVHTWMYHSDLLGGLAARIAHVPIIIWNVRHSNFSRQGTKFTTRFIIRACSKLSGIIPEVIQYCSTKARDVHLELGYCVEKSVVIPNGFDLQRFRPNFLAYESIRQELGVPTSALLIGMIARFNPQKNHIGFLKAAAALHSLGYDAHFLLAGRDVDSDNSVLMEMLRQARIQSIIHLLGPRDDIPDLMASLDVFVLPSSEGEAFPNVVGEAMACEVPCVVTDVGDAAYIVGSTGKVVRVNDTQQLSQAMSEFLVLSQVERKRLGSLARQRIMELFDITKVIQQYQWLYKNLFSSARG